MQSFGYSYAAFDQLHLTGTEPSSTGMIFPQGKLSTVCLLFLVSEQASAQQSQLAELTRRAKSLSTCVSKSTESRGDLAWLFSHGKLDRYNVFRHGELTLCPPVRAGYVHIFKSAGTTILNIFKQMCERRFGTNASVVKCNYPHCTATTLPVRGYRYFSLVRSPDERLLSAIFEVHKRQEGIDGDLLQTLSPSDFVKNVLTRVLDGSLSNAHLLPQVTFLMEDGKVMPSLAYLGRVENILDDLPAIAAELFHDSKAAAEARYLLNYTHARHRHESSYGADPVANLNVSQMRYDTKAMLVGSYIAAYMCLEYQ